MVCQNEICRKNLVENFKDNNIFKNSGCKKNSEAENVGRDVNLNQTDLIINWDQKYSDLIYVDPNHTNLNQPIPADLKNIVSIHDSDDTHAI